MIPDDDTILKTASTSLRVLDLEEAAKLTSGDRNQAYGNPVSNFQRTAAIFNAITGQNLTAYEASLFMVATKLARLETSPLKQDNYVDAMAYLGIVHECAEAEKREAPK